MTPTSRTASKTLRIAAQLMTGLLVSTVVACNTDNLTPLTTDAAVAATDTPANQAAVFGNRVMFAKGPGGKSKGNSGPGDPSACVLPDSLVLDVGPGGATFAAGGNSIVFPKNAVSSTVHIVMIPDGDATASVQFFPEGLQFNPSALPTLTINTDCIGNPANATIVYTDDLGNILEFKKSNKGKDGHSLTAQIEHFSRYAVSW